MICLYFITYKIFLYKRTSFCPAASILVAPRTQCFSLSCFFVHSWYNKKTIIAFKYCLIACLITPLRCCRLVRGRCLCRLICRSLFAVEQLVEFFDQASSILFVYLVRLLIAFKRGAVASIRLR